MKNGIIFANARAKAKEQNLFTEERLHRMTEAKSLEDAVRVLAEANYADGVNVNVNNFYEVLDAEEKLVTDFVREAVPGGLGIECFFLKNDYHNLKSVIKAHYAGISDFGFMLLPDGNISSKELEERYSEKKISFVNEYMGEAIKEIEKQFDSGNRSPRLIDTELDKAMYKEIADIIKRKETDKSIKTYFETQADAINIGTMLRTIRIGADFKFFESNFIEGGTLDLYLFKEAGTDREKFAKFITGSKYKELYAKVSEGDLSEFETAKDNFLLKMFSASKGDMFSIAPIVGYYLGKLNEIKVLRVVLICIKNKVDVKEMKKRVRELYA